jgi:hypothetical protein
MTDFKLQPEIKDRFLQLPTEVQNIILESGWEKVTRKIVEQNKLRIDQGAAIENEVMLTMFGFDKPEHFKENIIKRSNVDLEVADKIVLAVNEEIFSLIKEKLILETTEDQANFSPVTTDAPVGKHTNPAVIESREDIMSEIEKNEEAPKNNIIDEALTKPQISTPTKVDPYKEPII